MFKSLCILLVTEAQRVLSNETTRGEIEDVAEEVLTFAVSVLPAGKWQTIAVAALNALQEFEGKTPTNPTPVPPTDPASLTDGEIASVISGAQ